MKKILSLTLAVLMLAGILAACGPTEQPSTSSTGSASTQTSTTLASTTPPAEVKPFTVDIAGLADQLVSVWGDAPQFLWKLVFDTLVQMDEKGNAVYDKLAESHTVSDDGTVYTFKLRDGIKWHDGVAFTAEDYVWSVKTALRAAKLASVYKDGLLTIAGAADYAEGKTDEIAGLEADGNTLTFTLKAADARFIRAAAAFVPYPKHLLESEDPLTIHQSSFWKNPVGTGMYKIVEFQPNNYVIAVRNDDYYGTKPKIEKLKCVPGNSETIVARAGAGEVDFNYCISGSLANELSKDSKFSMTQVDLLYNRGLRANLMGYGKDAKGNDKIADPRIRQALAYAVDVQKICDTVFGGKAEAEYSFVNSADQFFDASTNDYSYNPDKAKQLLQEAGFDFSQKLIIGQFYNDTQTLDAVEAIKSYWEAIGVQVEINSMATGTDAVSYIYEMKPFDFCYAGIAGGFVPDSYSIYTSANSYGKMVFGDYTGTQFDELLDEFYKAVDPAKQKELISKLQKLEFETAMSLPMFNIPNWVFINTERVKVPEKVKFANQNLNVNVFFEEWELIS